MWERALDGVSAPAVLLGQWLQSDERNQLDAGGMCWQLGDRSFIRWQDLVCFSILDFLGHACIPQISECLANCRLNI